MCEGEDVCMKRRKNKSERENAKSSSVVTIAFKKKETQEYT